MGLRGRRRGAALLAAAACAAACASTPHNYLEPGQPLHGGAYGVAPAARPEIRVVTFNIEFGVRVDRAIEALRSHPRLRDADLLLLQEMDRAGVERIAQALALNYAYCPSSVHAKTRRDLGTAVLSPWPIEDRWKVRLPHLARMTRNARSVVGARVAIGGRAIRVYSVHFGTLLGLSGRERREQLEAVVQDARGSAEPVIVGGDFNSKSLAERLAGQGFTWPTRDIGATWKGFRFDHVLARGLDPAPAPSAGVAREVDDASDHRPAWVTFLAVPRSP
jgi:endonuclease/exonuclease/phosphatase family metal-dependent hydrolase